MSKLRLARLLVAGGAGFMGSAFVHQRLRADPEIELTVLDRVAAPERLKPVAGDPRVRLVVGDICDASVVAAAARDADGIVNFALETEDRSRFIQTNVMGTQVLLEAALRFRHQRFLQVSSGEVYGPAKDGRRREDEALAPVTPLAATMAGAEMLVRAYHASHGLPALITRGTMAYGPFQSPSDGIARWITCLLREQRVETGGGALRDYLHVDDHVAAIARILWKGEPGSVYNVGSATEMSEAEAAGRLLELCGKPASYRATVKDRRAPDANHLLDTRRLRPLGWEPAISFREGLRTTVDWYRKNDGWWRQRSVAERPSSSAVAN